MASGCWMCGNGSGGAMCPTHERQVRDTAKRESYPPLTRDQLSRGGRR
jgi:hypothetical protein